MSVGDILISKVDLRQIIAKALAGSAEAVGKHLVKVAGDLFPKQGDARLGKTVDKLSPLVAADLAMSGFSIEAPFKGRQKVHLLLYDFKVGKADLKDGHVRVLNLLRIPKTISRDFRIERVVGGASQTGPESATSNSVGNQALASERAAVVTSWLVFNLGVTAQSLQADSYGSSRPLIDRTGHPDGLEEPLNRYVIVTYSVAIRPENNKKPKKVPIPVNRPSIQCPIGASAYWSLDQKGEIALDITVPVLGMVGVGGGVAARVFELHKLDVAGNKLETRKFAAIGGGGVADVDPLLMAKEVQQVAELINTLRKIVKASSLSSMMTVKSWSTNLANMAAWLNINECLEFSDFNGTLMVTESLGAGLAGHAGAAESATFPILTRVTAGLSYDVGFSFAPSAALKRQSWIFFEL